ncbi:thiamine pyrophosphate-binding protein [Effusibacillus consociatus]|uniref:Thiamine pyrophosphate-binding protein n=1 Tax=Effusibacillus consociatus TaxID=1117041 RepID=A0ABV9PWL0_9BACL
MKAVRAVLEFLSSGGVECIFGIPAGSVNGFFDEMYDMPHLTPVITKHEGAAAYMAAAYAKTSKRLGVCIGCSGPGSTNLLTGAANAMREQLPVLFLTGAVPTNTVGLNASQEFDSQKVFQPLTKYSVTIDGEKDLLQEVRFAVSIALSGIPGPVHIAVPLDIQLKEIPAPEILPFPQRQPIIPDPLQVKRAAAKLIEYKTGVVFVGQGAAQAVPELLELAEILQWPIVTTPQAKGLLPDSHPLVRGVYGFAGQESAVRLMHDGDHRMLLIVGSSLGETATSNWNPQLTNGRFVLQLDYDPSVFNRKYNVDLPILGDANLSLQFLIKELQEAGLQRKSYHLSSTSKQPRTGIEYNTQNVLNTLQESLPSDTRYTIDIGEFMSYVIHYMRVPQSGAFDINVHFGAMGSAIGSAIGISLADSSRPVTCITGDGCFFMHGMEILTAKEYNLPVLFVVMNNSRLGMVYHGHTLQYKRSHPRFEQQPVNIAAMASAMGIPSARVEKHDDLSQELVRDLLVPGPSLLEIVLVDENIPPMGDRVKFLSSFGK